MLTYEYTGEEDWQIRLAGQPLIDMWYRPDKICEPRILLTGTFISTNSTYVVRLI